jgi:hypothetical protein
MPPGNTARKIIVHKGVAPPSKKQWIDWIAPPPHSSRWWLGRLTGCLSALLTLIFVAVLGLIKFDLQRTSDHAGTFITIVLFMVFGPLLWRLFRYGRRLRARHALLALKKDRRAPLLLLRAFRDDYHKLPG